MVMLEEMNDNIILIAENQTALAEKFESFRDEMHSFKDEMFNFRDEMYSFRDETRENFKFLSGHLLRIEDEIENIIKKLDKKADKDWVIKRLEKIESEINFLKKKVLSAS